MANNMIFFQIGSTDLSPAADIQDYEMNSADVYETWTDANWLDHRVIVRQRISGKVKLGYSSAASFTALQTLLAAARQADGSYTVTAYVQNTGAMATFACYIDTEGADKWDLKNSRQWQVVTLTITGR